MAVFFDFTPLSLPQYKLQLRHLDSGTPFLLRGVSEQLPNGIIEAVPLDSIRTYGVSGTFTVPNNIFVTRITDLIRAIGEGVQISVSGTINYSFDNYGNRNANAVLYIHDPRFNTDEFTWEGVTYSEPAGPLGRFIAQRGFAQGTMVAADGTNTNADFNRRDYGLEPGDWSEHYEYYVSLMSYHTAPSDLYLVTGEMNLEFRHGL